MVSPCWPLGTTRIYVEMIRVSVPLRTLIVSCSNWCLIASSSTVDWLCIVVRNDLVWLWRIALILCVVLVDLCLSVLWDCRLIGGGRVIVVALTAT